MFNATNKSDKWVVAIDDKRVEYDSPQLANELYNSVTSIEESPFGAMALLPPHVLPVDIFGVAATVDISEITTLVNADYVDKRVHRFALACAMPSDPMRAIDRLRSRRDWHAALFGC